MKQKQRNDDVTKFAIQMAGQLTFGRFRCRLIGMDELACN
jgi:hypothetical protein